MALGCDSALPQSHTSQSWRNTPAAQFKKLAKIVHKAIPLTMGNCVLWINYLNTSQIRIPNTHTRNQKHIDTLTFD